MIKSGTTGWIIRCEDCDEISSSGSVTEATVPLEDLRNNKNYDLRFKATSTEDGRKVINLLALEDDTSRNCLDSLPAEDHDRLKQLVKRIDEGGICGSLTHCPKSLQQEQNESV